MQSIDKLVLGTVQLGMDYGINNKSGKPDPKEAVSLLAAAYKKGIRCLDTAEAYGTAQEVIGAYHLQYPQQPFSIITKYKPRQAYDTQGAFHAAFISNLDVLEVDFLEAYLFHSYDSYKNFVHWANLKELQESGKLKKIGVSIYTNEQAYDVSADERVQVVQLPFNLLDNYHQRAGALQALKRNGKEIHSRSVFLQGLFFKEKSALSGKLEALRKDLEQLDGLAGEARINIAILALAYALRQPLIDRVLIGVDTKTQLSQNIEMLSAINHVNASLLSSVDQIEVAESALLNPSNW